MGDRQQSLSTALAVGLVASVAAGAPSAADLTVAAWGGLWEQSLRRCVVEPFEKRTGKTVDVVLGTAAQWMNQIAANATRPPLHIVYNPTDSAFEAIDRGFAERFTPEKVPNMVDLTPQFAAIGGGFGTVHNYGAMGILYNARVIKDPPKTWKDFVDGTIAGKWKAMMPNLNLGTTVNIWLFSHIYGGGINDIKPGLDVIKAMTASGNLQFWGEPNQVINNLKSGDADLAMYWDGRSWAFIAAGNADFKYYSPDPGVVVATTWIQKIKNSPDIGWDFVNLSLSPEAQTCFGSALRYGVANAKVKFAPEIEAVITPTAKLITPPFKDLPSRQSEWVEAWNKQIGR